MPEIDGYTFVVDMKDRGVRATLKTITAEARAMKMAMKSNFETLMQGGNTLQAYDGKMRDSQRVINTYLQAISKLQENMRKLDSQRKADGSLNEKDATAYARNARTIESYRGQITKLSAEIQKAARQKAAFVSGLHQTRTATESLSKVTKSYDEILGQSARTYQGELNRIKLLETQKKALERQTKLEIQSGRNLGNHLTSLRNQYARVGESVQSLPSRIKVVEAELRKQESSADADSASIQRLRDRLVSLKEELGSSKARYSALSESIQKTTSELGQQAVKANQAASKLREVNQLARSANPVGINRISAAVRVLDGRLGNAGSHLKAFVRESRVGLAGFATAAYAGGRALAASAKMSAELQQTWQYNKNLLETGAHSAKEARHEVALVSDMQRDARKYSIAYGVSQQDIAKQFVELTKRGYSASASLGSMKAMLEASRASGDDYGNVVKNVANVIDAFGMRARKSHHGVMESDAEMTKRLIADSKRISNSMAYAADMTATDFKKMGLAMSYVSNVAHSAGFSVEQTAGAIGVLSNNGIEGERAGTGLRKAINSLISPSKAGKAALQSVNLSLDDLKTKSGALKSLPSIMKLINKHTRELGKADKGAFFKALFGTTGMQAGMALAQNAEQLAKLTKEEKDAEKHNYIGRLAKKNMATAKGNMARLKQMVNAIAIDIGAQILPAINKVAYAASAWLGSKNGQKTLEEITGATKGLGKAASSAAPAVISFTGGLVKGLAGVVKIWGGAIKIVSSIGNFFGKIFSFGHGGAISSTLGQITGVMIGLTATARLLRGTFKGYIAYKQDLADITGLFKRQGTPLQQNNKLMERFIKLQERSLALAEKQAGITGAGSASLGKNKAKGVANEALDDGATVITTTRAERQAELAGAKGGSRWKAGFKRGVKALPGELAMFVLDPVGWSLSKAIDLGGFIGKKMFSGIKRVFAGRSIMPKFKFKIGNPFKLLRSKAGAEGAEAGSSFLGRFGGVLGKIGGFASKWFTPVALAASAVFAGIDIYKGIAQKKDRATNLGKGIGTLLGGGIGFVLGGPLGATIGATLGNVIGKFAGKPLAKWFKAGAENLPLVIGGFKKFFHGDWSGAWSSWSKAGKRSMKETGDWFASLGRKTKNLFTGKGWTDGAKKSKASRKEVVSLGADKYSKKDQQNVRKMNSEITRYTSSIKKLKATLKKNNPSKDLSSIAKSVSKTNKSWASSSKAINKIAKGFNKLGKGSKSITKLMKSLNNASGFKGITKNLSSLERALKKSKWGTMIAKQAEIASKSLTSKKASGFVAQFNAMTKAIIKSINSFSHSFKSGWERPWRGLGDPVEIGLSKVQSRANSILGKIDSKFDSFESDVLKGWKSWTADVRSAFESEFDKLPSIAAKSMQGIVSKLNTGISAVNSVISSFGSGGGRLSTIKYADGTGGHPGGNMIVNDSVRPDWKELVKFPGKPWTMFNDRNVLIPNAPAGTQVINGEDTKKLMNKAGVYHYADGTEEAKKLANSPIPELRRIFYGATSLSGYRLASTLGKGMGDAFLRAISGRVQELAEEEVKKDEREKKAKKKKKHRGFANGGLVAQHGLYEMAENNLPEVVIPLDKNKRSRAYQLLGEVNERFSKEDRKGSTVIKQSQDYSALETKFDQLINLVSELALSGQEQIKAIYDTAFDQRDSYKRQALDLRRKQLGI